MNLRDMKTAKIGENKKLSNKMDFTVYDTSDLA